MYRGHRHCPVLGKDLRALLMPAFKLWNTLTKSICVLNWSLQLWLCEDWDYSLVAWEEKPEICPHGVQNCVTDPALCTVHKNRWKTSRKTDITIYEAAPSNSSSQIPKLCKQRNCCQWSQLSPPLLRIHPGSLHQWIKRLNKKNWHCDISNKVF